MLCAALQRYAIALLGFPMTLFGPGPTVSHDALRLLAHARTAFAAVGEDGGRLYAAPSLFPDRSGLARLQARLWADDDLRLILAWRMYARRLGELQPHRDLNVLRGIVGPRMKESYALLAGQIAVERCGRRYGRINPGKAGLPNLALYHAASAVEAAAAIAGSATATIPQLGFINENPGQSFVLDIADFYRDTFTNPCTFKDAKRARDCPGENIERLARRITGGGLARQGVIPSMIRRIKALIAEDEK
jgi:CRISP-associated protein Cas1